MSKSAFLLWVVLWSAGQENTVLAYKECEKTYSRTDAFSQKELSALYARAEKSPTYELKIDDNTKADVVVWIDSANKIHFLPFFQDKWIHVDRPAGLEQLLDKHTAFIRGRHLEVFIVLDGKSNPEKAGEVVQLVKKKAYVSLTVMLAKKLSKKDKEAKH